MPAIAQPQVHSGARPRQLGRLTAAAMVAGYFSLLVSLGGWRSWSRLEVPSLKTNQGLWFADLRNVTSAWDCARRGVAVLPVNPCDPWRRPANYPRLWLALARLGLGQGSTVALGLGLACVFFVVALLVVPRTAGIGEGALYGLALVSPAVMLGVQRGNVDLALFVLVVVAVFLSRGGVGVVAGEALILLAALLKFFPVLSVGFLLRRASRVARIGAVTIAVACGAYVLATLDYTRRIFHAVPQVDYFTFGVRRFTEWLVAGVNEVWPRLAAGVNTKLSMRAWDLGVAFLCLALAFLFRDRLRRHFAASSDDDASREADLFWAGAGIYVVSYAVFESWDYRLAFMLLTVPQLVRWALAGRGIAIVTLAGLLAALWLDPSWSNVTVLRSVLSGWNGATALAPFHEPLPLAAFAQLVLFAGLLAAMIGTAPRWYELRQ